MYFNDISAANEIKKAPTPMIAKMKGRRVKNFNAQKWDKISTTVMTKAVLKKVSYKTSLFF